MLNTDPSEDAFGNMGFPDDGPYRTLREIMVWGKWKVKTSVLRYSKTHALLRAKACVPDDLKECGLEYMNRFGQRARKALV